ncbi:transposase, partial [Ligilactobacillus ruminis]
MRRNKQQGGEKGIRQKTIRELNEEYGWSISELCRTVGITRDAYYKWIKRGTSNKQQEQSDLLSAIMDLEKEHKGTLGYLGMTTQLASENRLYFKAGLKRVTNCMR